MIHRPLSSAVCLLLGLVVACASIDEQSAATDSGCYGPACTPTDAGKDQVSADVAVPDGASDSGPPAQNPLCGEGCMPDEPSACAGGVADSGSDAAGPQADAAAGQSSAPEAGLPPPSAGSADAGAGLSEAGPAGCFVQRGKTGPVAECAPAGTGATGAPCVSSSDCAAGFACVGEASAAQCRQFCCAGGASCQESGTYCAERPLRDDAMGAAPLLVPVCIQADDCSLDEPYPCPPNKQCKCKEGTACTVVSSDGTTSCVPPGTGQAGDACPCAPGHVCSLEKKTCIKICSTNTASAECGTGKCQSVSYLPKGFGVCVLTAADAG